MAFYINGFVSCGLMLLLLSTLSVGFLFFFFLRWFVGTTVSHESDDISFFDGMMTSVKRIFDELHL